MNVSQFNCARITSALDEPYYAEHDRESIQKFGTIYDQTIGMSFIGKSDDPKSPDTKRERLLTLRDSDGISVLVHWWLGDENIVFERV